MTVEEYDRLFELQRGLCDICGRKDYDKLGRRLAVDHDHTTGKIRGLLCYKCNIFLGHYSRENMVSAINYIDKYKITK